MSAARMLVLGGGVYSVQVVRELQAMGLRAHVVDRDADAPAFAVADDHAAADLSDPAQVLAAARAWNVSGVLPLNDIGVRTAAVVAEELGLIGVSQETADVANDKGRMRTVWRDAGLAVPEFRVVESLPEAARATEAVGYPLVVKPADSGGGGRGVSIVRTPEELEWSFEFARPFARNGRIVIESFLDGLELTIETLSFRGATTVLAMSDKVKPPLRTRVATSLNYPAALAPDTRAAVERLVVAAVAALGIENGPAHTEVILTDRGPVLVETGARGGGGHIFSTIVQAVSGVNFVQEAARVLTGGAPSPLRVETRGCVYRFFNPPPGILRGVHGLAEARAMPGVLDIDVVKPVGHRVGALLNGLERAGFVVVAGADRAEAVARADAVERVVAFDVEPVAT